jgi:hypothetical protein
MPSLIQYLLLIIKSSKKEIIQIRLVKQMKTKLIHTLMASVILFTSNIVIAQNRNEQIGQCVAGFMVSSKTFNKDLSKIPKVSRDAFLKYSKRLEDLDNKVYAKCRETSSECIRGVLKNNDDYQIIDSYYRTLSVAMQGPKQADAVITLGNTSCFNLNQSK